MVTRHSYKLDYDWLSHELQLPDCAIDYNRLPSDQVEPSLHLSMIAKINVSIWGCSRNIDTFTLQLIGRLGFSHWRYSGFSPHIVCFGRN